MLWHDGKFFLVGVGVYPLHESYQHDVINGMLCRKMSVCSTSETLPLCLRPRKVRTILRPTCSETKTSSQSALNASISRKYCSR